MSLNGVCIVFLLLLACVARLSVTATGTTHNVNKKSFIRRTTSSENKFEHVQGRIVGGHDATPGRNPYMVSLWSEWRHECGAVILAPDLLLTAAHCIQNGIVNSNMEIQKAILGRWDLNDPFESGTETITTSTKYMHDDYDPGTDEHDVGIIALSSSTTLPWVKINSNVNFVVPPETLTSLGWGDLGNGTFPDKLQEVQVNSMSNEACRDAPDPWNSGASYKTYIYNDMLCATDVGKDGCFGDSGGPLVYEGGPTHNDDTVVGITSWGIGCARMPGVYARTAHSTHWSWISNKVCTLSSNPPAYFGCNNAPSSSFKDDAFPTVEPITEEPSVQPSSAPTRRPTVTSNDNTGGPPAPTYAYTWGVTIPPIFEGAREDTMAPSESPSQLLRSGSGGDETTVDDSQEEGEAFILPSTDTVVLAAETVSETSNAVSSWLSVSLSVLLAVSTLMIVSL